ncbi:MAG: M14 family zinc carboxypeptidase [Candidatus Hodarchaeota archaeon]
MIQIRAEKISSIILAIMIIGIFLTNTAEAFPQRIATFNVLEPTSIDRTWDDVSLMYEGQFHDPAEVEEEIENIHVLVPELVDLEIIGQSYLGRDITCLRITNEQIEIQKAKTLVVAQHHGREQITVEIALRFILQLLNGYGVDSLLTEYIDTQEIYIIPTLNPDALELVVNQNNHYLRKNLRPFDNDNDGLFDEDPIDDANGDGVIYERHVFRKTGGEPEFLYQYYEGIDDDGDGLVNEDEVGCTDLNRNYDSYWGGTPGSSPDPTSQAYHGAEPFSEPETQAFRDFAERHRFAMAYSLHSGINATYFPDDANYHWLDPVLSYEVVEDFAEILPSSFNEIYEYPSHSETTWQDEVAPDTGYCGLWADWMYHERDSTLPICFELYHNESSDYEHSYELIWENSTHMEMEWKSIYGYFNPVESYIDDLWEEVKPAFNYLLRMTPRLRVDITTVSGTPGQGESISIDVGISNLSPRLGTVDEVELRSSNGDLLDSYAAVDGGSTDHYISSIPASFTGDDYTVLVGNNFTGYVSVTIGSTNPLFGILVPIGIGVALIAVVAVVFILGRRQ